MAAKIKKLVGPRGEFHDPYYPVSIINSSLESTKLNPELEIVAHHTDNGSGHPLARQDSIPAPTHRPNSTFISAYLLPSFKYIPFLPTNDSPDDNGGHLSPATQLKYFAQAHLVPSASSKNIMQFYGQEQSVNDVLILICGHGGRDVRCGILGPVLRDEFRSVLSSNGIGVELPEGASNSDGGTYYKRNDVNTLQSGERCERSENDEMKTPGSLARVGLISHIGGHKFAGNVIVYLPPQMKMGGNAHPLAGCGIWYGRVEPKHVEGIVKETILGGQVIKDLFRGGIRKGGEIIRM